MNRPSKPTPFDDDATGMRHLLGSLPDPGPMPDALASRIAAALDAERDARSQLGTVTPLPQRQHAPVSDEHDEHSEYDRRVAALWDAPSVRNQPSAARTRRWQVIAGVAAGLALVGSAGSLLLMRSSHPDDLAGGAMAFPSSSSITSVPNDSPRDVLESPSAPPSSKGFAAIPPSTSGALGSNTNPAFTSSNRDYTKSDVDALTAQVPPTQKVAPGMGGAVGVGPLATPLGVAQCLITLGVKNATMVTVDFARFEGKPAAVVVTASDSGKQARVVTRACGGSGGSPVLYGPVSLS